MKKLSICLFGTYNADYIRNRSIREGLLAEGVTVHEVHVGFPNVRMEMAEDYTLATTLWRIVRKVRAYIILASRWREIRGSDYIVVLHPGHLDLPLAWLIAKITGARLVFDASISPYDTMFVGRSQIARRESLKAMIVLFAERYLLKLADKIMVDTHGMQEFMEEIIQVPHEKLFIVPLGADDQLYKPGTSKKGKTVEVLFFGLYNEMHGAEYILKAAKKLAARKSIRFTMIGDGHLRQSFEQFVRNNKLTNITFEGFMPEKDLVSRLQKADILLGIFSKNPLFKRVIPNKVFAALACAKPLISADMPAMHEYFVHKKNSLLIAPKNSTALAEAILMLAWHKPVRDELAKNGYQTFKKYLSNKVKTDLLMKGIRT